MLTEDDWGDIWRLYHTSNHRQTFAWLDETTQRRVARIVDATLRAKAKADQPDENEAANSSAV